MAKARKEGKPKRNRRNLVKKLIRLEKNRIILNRLTTEIKNKD